MRTVLPTVLLPLFFTFAVNAATMTNFDSADPQIRISAIKNAVAAHRVKAMGKIARLALHDPNHLVRVVAAWAIGEMDLKMRQRLLATMADKDASAEVRAAAKEALEKLQGPPPPRDHTTQKTAPRPALGPCMKDTDCKGNRICTEPPKYARGWAKKAAVYGVFATGISTGLSLGATFNRKDMVLAIPLAGSATVFNVISATVIGAGAKSAKSNPEVVGSLSLRLIGWLSFGFHLTGSIALAGAIPVHYVKKDGDGIGWYPPVSWLLTNAMLGVTAIFALAMDALVADRQAVKKAREQAERFQMVYVAPIDTGGQISGVTGNLVVAF